MFMAQATAKNCSVKPCADGATSSLSPPKSAGAISTASVAERLYHCRKIHRRGGEQPATLDTDYIDVIQSHIDFRDPTMEIFVEGFQRLQKEGKVKAYGVSTSDFEYLKAFNADGGCASLQIDYSILNRTAEEEIFPYCQQNNIGVIVRGGLAMGILGG
jgi:aryl-alcohol dehydrogenase-like predicted oxidoreductase